MNKTLLKKIITDFENYSKNLLNTTYEKVDADMYRFKKYIDETIEIKNILNDAMRDSEVKYEDYFLTTLSNVNFMVPLDEKDHIKAIYDYITMIIENKVAVLNIATCYHCESRKYNDILRNFMNMIIFPLINYISNELTKKLMEYDDIYPNVTLNANNSPVYFQSSGNQIVNYNTNDLTEINELFDKIISDLKVENELANPEILDDIELMKETVNKDNINKHRVQNIIKRITEKIKIITATTTQAILLKESIELLIEKVIEMIGG